MDINCALQKLKQGNQLYLSSCQNPADISCMRRMETAKFGQKPYAVVVTCSDSRVPPEHIFSAGLGDLFVVRTAGNVVGAFEIGSVEYAVEHLNVPVVVVMGHTHCGAVQAALKGSAHGYIEDIICEIRLGLTGDETENEAIQQNILHSRNNLLCSKIICSLLEMGKIIIVCAEYDMNSGKVYWFNIGTCK